MTTGGREFLFPGLGRRLGVARFDGGDITSDGGLLLLTKVEARTGIVERFARLLPWRVRQGWPRSQCFSLR